MAGVRRAQNIYTWKELKEAFIQRWMNISGTDKYKSIALIVSTSAVRLVMSIARHIRINKF